MRRCTSVRALWSLAALLVIVATPVGAGAAPTLRGFDLDILYDPALLAFDGLDFDVYLGRIPDYALVAVSHVAPVVDFTETSRVRATFTTPGQYVWHCHIVEHEDNEMMRPYRIGPVQPGQPPDGGHHGGGGGM